MSVRDWLDFIWRLIAATPIMAVIIIVASVDRLRNAVWRTT